MRRSSLERSQRAWFTSATHYASTSGAPVAPAWERSGYGAITPKAGECENLLVPFALSASHVAFGSIRMEPTFMILSQSAATAACLAIDDGVSVQEVNYEKLARKLKADGQVLAK